VSCHRVLDTFVGFHNCDGDILHDRAGGVFYDPLNIPRGAHALSKQVGSKSQQCENTAEQTVSVHNPSPTSNGVKTRKLIRPGWGRSATTIHPPANRGREFRS